MRARVRCIVMYTHARTFFSEGGWGEVHEEGVLMLRGDEGFF